MDEHNWLIIYSFLNVTFLICRSTESNKRCVDGESNVPLNAICRYK